MIEVNGSKIQWHEGMTISELIKMVGLENNMLVVTVDDKLVSHKAYDNFKVPDGVKVKILAMIHGG